MATITISYDQNNTALNLLLQAMRELGAEMKEKREAAPTAAEQETLQAIDEMKRGETVKFNSFDDFKKAMYEL